MNYHVRIVGCYVLLLLGILQLSNKADAFVISQRRHDIRIRHWCTLEGDTAAKEEVLDIPIGSSSTIGQDEWQQIDQLIKDRSSARWDGNYDKADQLRQEIEDLGDTLKGFTIIFEDLPRKDGGGTNWSVVPQNDGIPELMEGPTVLQLAHAALGLAVEASTQQSVLWAKRAVGATQQADNPDVSYQDSAEYSQRLDNIVAEAKVRLTEQSVHAIQQELGGRKSADAAFWFALGGCADVELFDLLTKTACTELERFGNRSSCRSKDVYQILERLSAAGITCELGGQTNKDATLLVNVAKESLLVKENCDIAAIDDVTLNLHWSRSLLLIWKFSTKQKKQRAFLNSAVKHWERRKLESDNSLATSKIASAETVYDHPKNGLSTANDTTKYDWSSMFLDPTLPLVIDVGCGMGISPLGLASLHGETDQVPEELSGGSSATWSQYNCCGVDLGGLGIGYAKGVAKRLGLDNRLAFVVDSAENFCEAVQQSYPGPVKICLIQFPTPYRLEKKVDMGENEETMKGGNSQLPQSAYDGFMVTESLLKSIHDTMQKSDGRLLLQSNCEDVAVFIKHLACESVGFKDLPPALGNSDREEGAEGTDMTMRIPQRTTDWIAMGGERASGSGWISHQVLPEKGATETEVACILNRTPVHRCILSV